MAKIIVFDMDGTVCESTARISREVCEVINKLKIGKAIVSGATFKKMRYQLSGLTRFWLFPLNGGEMYLITADDYEIHHYKREFPLAERKRIIKILNQRGFNDSQIDDRVGQVTISYLGKDASYEDKLKWDPDHQKREVLVKEIQEYLPEYKVKIGGTTSIDIAPWDKSSCIYALCDRIGYSKEDIVFIGDALFEGGNDHAVLKTGVRCIQTSGPQETLKIIKEL